ncbi:flagellar hook-associated protein 2 [Caldalkalibacillus uzonensis]|uniref:Flagellar hook-associated protein 2 n=1 Tax=Caldalkalibacillus uzonensis TaxID=353224 RepID=A0ABU0CUX9_9BACI|nr:flagellar hook-associated protein 2 [Caldalkalibacillus uzonensis]MDQ0339918.1 flagellar hook-associated protein 2 [Caldalkalibacillus uzonensis]
MRIAGLASGMDINQIVNDLMRAERIPMDKLFQRREWLSWQRDAYREMTLALRNFRDTYANMRLQSTFIALQATSSDSSGLKATATASAVAGTYTVDVLQLAKGAEIRSENRVTDNEGNVVQSSTKIFEAMGRDSEADSFTIKVSVENGTTTRTAEIIITKDDTFASLARKLSQASVTEDGKEVSLGLQASFDNTLGRFFISTRDTGADMKLTIEDGVDGGGNSIEFIDRYILGRTDETAFTGQASGEGQNAQLKFDDIDDVIESSTNTISVRGLTLTLHQTGNYTVSVQSNPDQVFDQIKSFVDAYNELIDMINVRLNEPRYRDYPPLTDEQREALSETEAKRWDERARSGLLRNDPILRQVLVDLRQAWTNPVEGIPAGQLRQLAEIGITTTSNWRDGGKLEINETKLREAIAERPDEVMALFTQAPQEDGNREQMGIGRRIYQVVGDSINRLRDRAGSPGVTAADQSVLGRQLRDVEDQLARWEDRLARIEERYWRQFTAMEKAMQQMNEQSMFLLTNFFGMQGF